MRCKNSFVIIALFMCLGQTAVRAQGPEPAKKILDSALQVASSTHRNVFLIFHASWCIWCRRLDSVLTNAEVSPLIAKHLVVTRLDVLEHSDKKATLENPGAEEILRKLGGEESGLPYYAFLNAKGKKITDSNVMPGKSKNIGFPGSSEEKTAFQEILRKSSPSMTAAELSAVMSHFDTK